MAKGKKTDNETIYKVMLSVFSTGNYSETARQLKMPESTVEDIYKRNIEKEEFAKLRDQKKEEFVENATRIIGKATSLLERRIDMALNNQNELEEIIDEIWDIDKSKMNETRKRAAVTRISKMQLNNLSEITTAIGTMYDKRNLAEGKSTENAKLDINITVVE